MSLETTSSNFLEQLRIDVKDNRTLPDCLAQWSDEIDYYLADVFAFRWGAPWSECSIDTLRSLFFENIAIICKEKDAPEALVAAYNCYKAVQNLKLRRKNQSAEATEDSEQEPLNSDNEDDEF